MLYRNPSKLMRAHLFISPQNGIKVANKTPRNIMATHGHKNIILEISYNYIIHGGINACQGKELVIYLSFDGYRLIISEQDVRVNIRNTKTPNKGSRLSLLLTNTNLRLSLLSQLEENLSKTI